MSLISIIVPMYNSEATIEKCIFSLRAQTYKDIEVIIVDDGSTDGSESKCRDSIEGDSRFRYIRQEHGGVSSARNRGMSFACGEYVCFVDSDDWVDPGYAEKLLECISANDADCAVCGYTSYDDINPEPHIPAAAVFEGREQIARAFLNEDYELFWNSQCIRIYKRELIAACCEDGMTCGEDLVFNMRYLSGVNRLAFLGESLYFYYVPAGVIKSKDNNAKQCRIYAESVKAFLEAALPESEYLAFYERFVCRYICVAAAMIARDKPYGEAVRKIREFYLCSLFRRVLRHKAWRGLNMKYTAVGWLLRLRFTFLLIVAAKF